MEYTSSISHIAAKEIKYVAGPTSDNTDNNIIDIELDEVPEYEVDKLIENVLASTTKSNTWCYGRTIRNRKLLGRITKR